MTLGACACVRGCVCMCMHSRTAFFRHIFFFFFLGQASNYESVGLWGSIFAKHSMFHATPLLFAANLLTGLVYKLVPMSALIRKWDLPSGGRVSRDPLQSCFFCKGEADVACRQALD